MTTKLWTSADIAKEIGVAASVVANWSYYGRDYIPEPAALTQSGTKLWSTEQAWKIIADYWQRKTKRDAQAADRERAKQALARLVSA